MRKSLKVKTIIAILFTVFLLTVHSTVEAADNTPSEVGGVTVEGCCINFSITDNVAVDKACTDITIGPSPSCSIIPDDPLLPDPTPKDSCKGWGTPNVICEFCFAKSADCLLTINACDTSLNQSGIQTLSIIVGECSEPKCVSVEPKTVRAGETVDLTIKYDSAPPISGPTFSCNGITINSTTVTGDTEIKVNITPLPIPPNADPEECCVLSGSDTEIVPACCFKIMPPPVCTSIEPSSINSGETKDITITGKNFTGITKDDIAFEGCGITVNSVTVNSDTEITANITAGTVEQNQSCTASLMLAGAITGYTIEVEVVGPQCKIVEGGPIFRLRSGWLFPKTRRIEIRGEGECNWDRTCSVSIEDVNIIIPLLKQPNRITAIIVIPSTLGFLGPYGGFEPGKKRVCVVCGSNTTCGTIIIGYYNY